MSKLCSFIKKDYVLVFILGLLLPLSIKAAPTAVDTTHLPGTSISINVQGPTVIGETFQANINATTDDVNPIIFSGFDFLIEFNPHLIIVGTAEPGAYLDSCNWEYFTYSFEAISGFAGDEVTGAIRIVAVADLNNSSSPHCLIENNAEIVKLNFLVQENSQDGNPLIGADIFLKWFWEDCGDNSFASSDGSILYISDQVFDENGFNITADSSFTTYNGAPLECIPSGVTSIARGVNYYASTPSSILPIDSTQFSGTTISIDGFYSVPEIGSTFEARINATSFDLTPNVFSGFDLLFSYDPEVVTLESAVPGAYLDSCAWEYFNYRFEGTTGLIRVVAVADLNDSNNPLCLLDGNAELVKLYFPIAYDFSLIGKKIDLTWYWNDCGDNTFASSDGSNLYVSDQVYDRFGNNITADSSFPTYTGTPTTCDSLGPSPIISAVNFQSHFPTTIFSNNLRSDINLNGISYEIADFFMYINYFVFGVSAFTNDLDQQIIASDVNADGLTLTLDDLVYLYRVIIGDAIPDMVIPIQINDTVVVTQDLNTNTVSIDYPDSLLALYLIFDDYITPIQDTLNPNQIYYNDSLATKILYGPTLGSASSSPVYFGSGNLFSYTGNGKLIEVQASFDGVSNVPVSISSCCQQRGNIDRDIDGIIDISDLIYIVAYMFQAGTPPLCLEEANINGVDSSIDISDLVYLVQYLFADGPIPVECL